MKRVLFLILTSCACVLIVLVNVFALMKINFEMSGSISFIAYDKQVYIEDLILKNVVKETEKGYQTENISYNSYKGVYLKQSNSIASLSGQVLNGETMEIHITMKNLKENYLKTLLSYSNLPEGVLIRSTGLYMPQNIGKSVATGQSRTLKIYITNQSETLELLDLAEIDIKVIFTEVESLLIPDNTENPSYFYVEMGTIPGIANSNGFVTEEYLKWRYISADGLSPYTQTIPPTSVSGTYILETNVKNRTKDNALLRGDNYGLSEISFNNDYSYKLYSTTSHGFANNNSNIFACDYANSNLRKYVTGRKVYKSFIMNQISDAEGNKSIVNPNTTSHYSDMFTDFCIDVDNDLIYNRIKGRTLSDLYETIWTGLSTTWTETVVGAENRQFYAEANGINMQQSDKFWIPSYVELRNWYGDLTVNNSNASIDSAYHTRTPREANSDMEFYIDAQGKINFSMIFADRLSARACFKIV